ncbi:MAG: hypothetical protein IPO21_09965 [Bacteroidales bacterium]|nr:hypothetical protein [Bacteroidales bacterium]
MKSILIKAMFLLSLTIFVLSACEKEETEPKKETTYKITATIGDFEFKSTDAKGTADGWFVIEGKAYNNSNTYLRIRLPEYATIALKDYPIGEHPRGIYSQAYYLDVSGEYESNEGSPASEKVTITKFDSAAKLISGTFDFTLYEDDTVTTKIISGTFTDITW